MEIENYLKVNSEFLDLLNAKISKGSTKIPEINNKLTIIKEKFSIFREKLVNFIDKIDKDVNLKGIWHNFLQLNNKEDIFSSDYSIPKLEYTFNDAFNCNEFDYKSEFLSLPIIALDNNINTIKCCYKELNYSFDSICPSLYKNKQIIFNILSFLGKNVDLQMNISIKKITYLNDVDNTDNSIKIEINESLITFQILENIIKLLILIP